MNRVREALDTVGRDPWLVGFEAVGIQDFIAANGRPLAMEGASRLVERFDREIRDASGAGSGGGTVFAGGGRGMKVVAQDRVEATLAELRDRYRSTTCGGQLATAAVPYERDQAGASLKWLRMKLGGAKDSALAPEVSLPKKASEKCTDCRSSKIETHYEGAEGPVRCCKRCAAVVEAGRRSGKRDRLTLEDIETEGMVAVVSADGNNLGAMFAGLESLEDTAICSDLVFGIFKEAHGQARPADGKCVDPIVGGDDIRVFLPPQQLLSYVTTLARVVEQLSRNLAHRDLPPAIATALTDLGVGVGAVIAPYHFPAARLIAMAHDFEDTAKGVCVGTELRSAFDFVWLVSGQELSQGIATLGGAQERPPPLALGNGALEEYIGRASALREVPSSQRAMLVRRRGGTEDERELMNLFRYQVARSRKWQAWFTACGVDWRDPVALASNLPDARMLSVAALVGIERSGMKQ